MYSDDDRKLGILTFGLLVLVMLSADACDIWKSKLRIIELENRLTRLENDLGVSETWRPEPWMFQPAMTECNPDDWRCESE